MKGKFAVYFNFFLSVCWLLISIMNFVNENILLGAFSLALCAVLGSLSLYYYRTSKFK